MKMLTIKSLFITDPCRYMRLIHLFYTICFDVHHKTPDSSHKTWPFTSE